MQLLNNLLVEVFNALYYIFPAYCANGAPVIFGGGRSIDSGKLFIDGKPLFGSHKTIRGFIAGLAIGTFVGWLQEAIAPAAGFPKGSVLLGFMLSLGAMIGDLAGSFLKRRLSLDPGAPLPIIDQIDFALMALLMAAPVKPPTIVMTIIILVLTVPIHLLINICCLFCGL